MITVVALVTMRKYHLATSFRLTEPTASAYGTKVSTNDN
jgi:hypothetical protein